MRVDNKLAILMWAGAISICPAYGDDNVSAPRIDAAGRAQVIAQLDRELQARYVFPDVAAKVVHQLNTKEANGGYAAADSPASFAETLDRDLRKFGDDEHLGVRFKPDFKDTANAGAPTAQEVQAARQEVVRGGFGIARVEHLPGNVGYIDLREFDPVEFSAPAYTAALSLLRGTDALILDLRRNAGGDPESVAFLLSHFFAEGDDRHLNDVYDRASDSTRQFWTTESVNGRYGNPVYVLISSNTFSAGEECAYDLHEQKRATLIGEPTRGGANPGSNVVIGHELVAFIPFARAINPMTHTNWEHVGVKPDISVAASKAERTAYEMVLKALISANNDPEQRNSLEKILLQTESETGIPPDTLPPH